MQTIVQYFSREFNDTCLIVFNRKLFNTGITHRGLEKYLRKK